MQLLLVAAIDAEAAHLPAALPRLITGPGKTAAAAATAAALARYADPTGVLVVNVGTAGALHDGVSGFVVPATVMVHDLSAEAIRALGVETVDRIDLDVREGLGTGHVLATGDQFIESETTRAALAAHADAVDMEGFAVAYAARAAGATVMCVKHVSDSAGDSARTDWPTAVDASARALAAWVREHL